MEHERPQCVSKMKLVMSSERLDNRRRRDIEVADIYEKCRSRCEEAGNKLSQYGAVWADE